MVQEAYLRAWKGIGPLPWRRAVLHVDVPDHRERRVHTHAGSAAASAPSRSTTSRPIETRVELAPRAAGRGGRGSSSALGRARRAARPSCARSWCSRTSTACRTRRSPRSSGSRSRRRRFGCTGPEEAAGLLYDEGRRGPCSVTRSPPAARRSSTASRVDLAVQRHIESCLRCQAELARYRRMLRRPRRCCAPVPRAGARATRPRRSPHSPRRPSAGDRPLLSGRRLAYAGAIGGSAPPPAAATAAVLIARVPPPRRRDRPRRLRPQAGPSRAGPAAILSAPAPRPGGQ